MIAKASVFTATVEAPLAMTKTSGLIMRWFGWSWRTLLTSAGRFWNLSSETDPSTAASVGQLVVPDLVPVVPLICSTAESRGRIL